MATTEIAPTGGVPTIAARPWRGRASAALLAGRGRARAAVAAVAGWRFTAAVPALAGAGLIAAAAALRFGIWAGLAAGGAFCLRYDART